MASGGAALQVTKSQPDLQALQADGSSAYMLLYLNKHTWVEHGDALEKDVRASQAAGLKVLLVHENDASKGGCDFGLFFATTPPGLINDGLYSDIAIALHTPPHRAVSLTLVAQAVGAVKTIRRPGRSPSARYFVRSSAVEPAHQRVGEGGTADDAAANTGDANDDDALVLPAGGSSCLRAEPAQ